MTIATLANPAQRVGVYIKGAVLKAVVSREVLNLIGEVRKHPKNVGGTVTYRRWLNKNATTSSPNQFFADATGDRGNAYAAEHMQGEGITPNAESLVPQDITVSLNEYSVLFGYSKRTADLHEDNVPAEMQKKTGQRLSLVREMVLFGQAKTCTNQFWGGTGTARDSVNGAVTLKLLRKITKSLDVNHAEKVTDVLRASSDYGTTDVEPAFFVFIHTDLKPDFRNMPGFRTVSGYGSFKPVSKYEFGTIEEFRVIASPELISVQDAGAAVGTLGLISTSAANIDVYQMVVAGKDAWGAVALRGKDALETYVLKPSQHSKSDPTGQRGYVGASCYYAAVLKNSGHMAIAEVGASDLEE